VELVAFMAGQLTSISTDPGNQLQAGQDGGLFVQTLWADVPDW
jgi:hypothetical protein